MRQATQSEVFLPPDCENQRFSSQGLLRARASGTPASDKLGSHDGNYMLNKYEQLLNEICFANTTISIQTGLYRVFFQIPFLSLWQMPSTSL